MGGYIQNMSTPEQYVELVWFMDVKQSYIADWNLIKEELDFCIYAVFHLLFVFSFSLVVQWFNGQYFPIDGVKGNILGSNICEDIQAQL